MDRITERRPYNAVSDFVDSHIAAGRGNKAAFVDPERSLIMASCRRARSASPTRCAISGSGPSSASRCCSMTPSTIRWRSGARPRRLRRDPAQHLPDAAADAYILADCRAQAIVAYAALADAIRPALETLPRKPALILVGGTTIPRARAFESLIAKADTTPVTADTVSDEVAFWMYTSGSTGDPKGVKHVHSNLMATAKLFGQGILGITETMSCIPPRSCSSRMGSAMP